MTVKVHVDERDPVVLRAGEELLFGRNPGPGKVSDDPTVSGDHGVIAATEVGWTMAALGRFFGVVVYDTETPSRLHVPRGIGPLPIPFARAAVIIEAPGGRAAMMVEGGGFPGWQGSWGSVREEAASLVDAAGTSATEGAWADLRFEGPRRQVLRWYQVLVAMCEPFLTSGATGDSAPPVPTNGDIARRLGISTGMVGGTYIGQVRSALGFQNRVPQLRQSMVTVALAQRIVTQADLVVLDVTPDDA